MMIERISVRTRYPRIEIRFPRLAGLALAFVVACAPMAAQPFDSGSNGSDGALTFAPGAGTVEFDPSELGIDLDHDSIYHFTTITIPVNVTVKLRAPTAGWNPIYWLASGDVIINGTLDLSGDQGHQASHVDDGEPSFPGPGGYPGGQGGSNVIGTSWHNGTGPGGQTNSPDKKAEHPGNYFLQPLSGGSGGAGGEYTVDSAGGGAGGGGFLLAGNTSVSINGSILANGGDGGRNDLGYHRGGGGAGGAVHILTPNISGSGTISAKGRLGARFTTNRYHAEFAEDGWVRIEAATDEFSVGIDCSKVRRVNLVPSATHILPGPDDPWARVARIGGIDLSVTPTASFVVPDVVLDATDPVLFEIEASNIPLGTPFKILLWNQTELLTEFSTIDGLAGTVASSTAVAMQTVPNGLTWGYLYASWNP